MVSWCSDEHRLIERFQNSEKFYIQLLNNANTAYLTKLPDDLRATLTVFLDTFEKIFKFHGDTFYPKLLQCEMKIITICDLIKTHLDHFEFNNYFKYAAYVHEALQMIQNNYLNAVRITNFQSILLFGLILCTKFSLLYKSGVWSLSIAIRTMLLLILVHVVFGNWLGFYLKCFLLIRHKFNKYI